MPVCVLVTFVRFKAPMARLRKVHCLRCVAGPKLADDIRGPAEPAPDGAPEDTCRATSRPGSRTPWSRTAGTTATRPPARRPPASCPRRYSPTPRCSPNSSTFAPGVGVDQLAFAARLATTEPEATDALAAFLARAHSNAN